MSAVSVFIRKCSHFKDLPACLNASLCENRTERSQFLYHSCITAAVVCGIGIINNIACLCALLCRKKFMRASTHRLVVTGSVINLLVVIVGFIVGLEFSLPQEQFERRPLLIGVLQGSTCTIISCLHLYRTWIALLIGFERYLLVSKPLFFRAYWTRTTVNILILACAVLVIATRVPLILNIIFDLDTWKVCAPLAHSMNVFIDLLFQTIIPLIVLPLMSVGVYVTMRKSFRWRGKVIWMIPASVKQGVCKHTAMSVHKAMMAVLFVYIFLTIPMLPGGLLRFVIWSGGIKKQCDVMALREIMESIANISSLLISSLDFYIYLLCWPRFRRIFLHLLPKKWRTKKEENSLEDSACTSPIRNIVLEEAKNSSERN